MKTLEARIERLEQDTPGGRRAVIEQAKSTGDFTRLTDRELIQFIAEGLPDNLARRVRAGDLACLTDDVLRQLAVGAL